MTFKNHSVLYIGLRQQPSTSQKVCFFKQGSSLGLVFLHFGRIVACFLFSEAKSGVMLEMIGPACVSYLTLEAITAWDAFPAQKWKQYSQEVGAISAEWPCWWLIVGCKEFRHLSVEDTAKGLRTRLVGAAGPGLAYPQAYPCTLECP